jgi:hypothetical protein
MYEIRVIASFRPIGSALLVAANPEQPQIVNDLKQY